MASFTAITAAILTGLVQTAPAPDAARDDDPEIVVRAPISPAERKKELRNFVRKIMRTPRRGRPFAKFAYPICPKVSGISPADARAIEDRIKANAASFGLGADPNPQCIPTVRVAFMVPAAGPPTTWLSHDAASLAHLPKYQRSEVLSEAGPVRAWNKIKVRDFYGRPIGNVGGDAWGSISRIEPQSGSDPIITAEITGAAILIEREAAKGLSLAQLADYATMRGLLGVSDPEPGTRPSASTILTLFQRKDAPAQLTTFDRALITGLYSASRNSSARRVVNTAAAAAAEMERAP